MVWTGQVEQKSIGIKRMYIVSEVENETVGGTGAVGERVSVVRGTGRDGGGGGGKESKRKGERWNWSWSIEFRGMAFEGLPGKEANCQVEIII